jgi:hypothetical protein
MHQYGSIRLSGLGFLYTNLWDAASSGTVGKTKVKFFFSTTLEKTDFQSTSPPWNTD